MASNWRVQHVEIYLVVGLFFSPWKNFLNLTYWVKPVEESVAGPPKNPSFAPMQQIVRSLDRVAIIPKQEKVTYKEHYANRKKYVTETLNHGVGCLRWHTTKGNFFTKKFSYFESTRRLWARIRCICCERELYQNKGNNIDKFRLLQQTSISNSF